MTGADLAVLAELPGRLAELGCKWAEKRLLPPMPRTSFSF
jgi:hypothetical protein